jgi:cullin 3
LKECSLDSLVYSYIAEKTWKFLERAIQEINNRNSSGLSFEELHRNAYNMVVNKHGDLLYSGLVQTSAGHLREVAMRIAAVPGDAILTSLRTEWDAHIQSFKLISQILMHMDRVYVKQVGKKPVHELGLDLWRDLIVRNPNIGPRMQSVVLEMISRERNGEMMDRTLIRSVTSMLADLGQAVYSQDFEEPFLDRTAEFYKSESQSMITSYDCPSYLQHAEKRLAEEAERVTSCLHPSTGDRVASVAQKELIAAQVRPLLEMEGSGAVFLMEHDLYDPLLRMYILFSQVGSDAPLRDVVSTHLRTVGRSLVMESEHAKDSIEFVQRLLSLRDKYELLLSRAFSSDKTFQAAINSAFEYFINLNRRSAEYISLFMDDKLRKGLKGCTEEETESVLDKTISLFRYLSEKDVFEKYYKQHLAKRLLHGKSSSDDAERSLLVKLRTECGFQFTSKLESMFTDVRTSKDIMAEFKSHLTSNQISLGLDMTVQVLTTGAWPSSTAGQRACNLPREVDKACEEFTSFYHKAYSGRRLTWQTGMGNAELRVTFGDRKHEISCSTLQMVVLLLFNDADCWTFQEISRATSIPDAELQRVLQSLACVKGKNVLRKDPMSKDVNPTDTFTVNDEFSSKLFRVRIGTITAQRESEAERNETQEKVEEDRKPQVEAAIVRIMKSRRVLSHNDVVAEVTRQLSTRFNPAPALIKKRIESLIEREYIERDSKDRTVYRYVA